MNPSYHNSAALDREQFKALCERKDGPGLVRVAVQGGLLLVLGVLAFTSVAPALRDAAFVLYSVLLGTVFGGFHETLHRTAFRSNWLNEPVYAVASTLLVTPPLLYRLFHFQHHRHTHTLGLDPELPVPALARWPGNPLPMLVVLSGLPMLLGKLLALAGQLLPLPGKVHAALFPYIPGSRRARLFLEGWAVVAVHAAAIGALVAAGDPWWRWPLSWWISHAVLSTYVSVEHTGLPTTGTVLERTRSMRTHGLMRFLFWNMPYHAEHHGWPAVPFWQLPALSERVRGDLVHVSTGYASLLGRVFLAVARGRTPPLV